MLEEQAVSSLRIRFRGIGQKNRPRRTGTGEAHRGGGSPSRAEAREKEATRFSSMGDRSTHLTGSTRRSERRPARRPRDSWSTGLSPGRSWLPRQFASSRRSVKIHRDRTYIVIVQCRAVKRLRRPVRKLVPHEAPVARSGAFDVAPAERRQSERDQAGGQRGEDEQRQQPKVFGRHLCDVVVRRQLQHPLRELQ